MQHRDQDVRKLVRSQAARNGARQIRGRRLGRYNLPNQRNVYLATDDRNARNPTGYFVSHKQLPACAGTATASSKSDRSTDEESRALPLVSKKTFKKRRLRGFYSRTLKIPTAISEELFDTREEASLFDFFRKCTIPSSTENFDCEFWSRIILQASHSDAAVRYGLLALSCLHRRSEHTTSVALQLHDVQQDPTASRYYTRAAIHSQALLHEAEENSDLLQKVLIICIVFVSYENARGNYEVAQMHLQNGLRIQVRARRHVEKRYDYGNVVEQTLYRLEWQAMMMFRSDFSLRNFELKG